MKKTNSYLSPVNFITTLESVENVIKENRTPLLKYEKIILKLSPKNWFNELFIQLNFWLQTVLYTGFILTTEKSQLN